MTDRVYELLAKPGIISKKIRQIDIQIEGLNMSMLPAGMTYDSAKVQTSVSDPMAEYAARLDDLNRKRADLCTLYMQAQDAVSSEIAEMDDENEKTVLLARFIGREDFSGIASRLSMCERNMFRIYRRALSHLDDVIKKKLVSECQ